MVPGDAEDQGGGNAVAGPAPSSDDSLSEKLKGRLGRAHDRPGQLAGRLSEYAELAGLVLAFVAKLRGGRVLTAADVMAEADTLCASVQALRSEPVPAIDPVQAP